MAHARRRLSSWKEIAAYLERDVRTVARWERERALPVHRVPGGRGPVIFAWTDEIDAWLTGSPQTAAAAEQADPPQSAQQSSASTEEAPRRRSRFLRVTLPASLLVLAVLGVVRIPWSHGAEQIGSVAAAGDALVAYSTSGQVIWRHAFPEPIRLEPPSVSGAVAIGDLDGDGRSEVLAVLGMAADTEGRQALYCFSNDGALRWRISPQDVLRFGSDTYRAPWSSGPVITYTAGEAGRAVWLTHHHTWWPGVARLLDRDGRQIGEFVNPGWLTSVSVTTTGQVLLAGTNNAEQSDAFIVTDDASWPGAAPPPADDAFACRNCPPGRPTHYFLLPRLELRRATGIDLTPLHIHPYPSGTELEVHQIEGDGRLPTAALVVDFAPDFTPLRARANDAYWSWHERLHREGRIDHAAADCPDRRGFTVREWQRTTGWKDRFVPAG